MNKLKEFEYLMMKVKRDAISHTEKMDELKEIITSLRRNGHHLEDGDCWFSCPQHPNYCGILLEDTEEDELPCYCGLEEHDNKIDRALAIIEKEIMNE